MTGECRASKSFWPNDDAPALISWLKMNNVSEISALLACPAGHHQYALQWTHISPFGKTHILNNIVTIYPASSYTEKHSTLTSSTILAINKMKLKERHIFAEHILKLFFLHSLIKLNELDVPNFFAVSSHTIHTFCAAVRISGRILMVA